MMGTQSHDGRVVGRALGRVLGYVRQQHVGLVALMIALGGTSYAATSLPRSSVGTRQLQNGAVTGAKLHKNAVTSAKVKDRSLLAKDFKKGQIPTGPRGPAGATGPAGPAGPAGPVGPSTGKAGGDLTGNYPNPKLANGSVTTAAFAAGAQAPDSALLGGQPATHYLGLGSDGTSGSVPVHAYGYFMNTSTASDYPFGQARIETTGTAGQFRVCGNLPGVTATLNYVVYDSGTRSTGTVGADSCSTPFTVTATGDFTVTIRRAIVFGVQSGDSTTNQNFDLYGFSQL